MKVLSPQRATNFFLFLVLCCTNSVGAFVVKSAARHVAPITDVKPRSGKTFVSNEEFDRKKVCTQLDPNDLFDTASMAMKAGGPPLAILTVTMTDSIPLVPTQPISVLAGAVLGFSQALPCVIAGQVLATTFSFLVGREILQNNEKFSFFQSGDGSQETTQQQRVFEELTSGLNNVEDWKQVFGTIVLLRQSPVIPFSLGNYFVGAATKAPLLPTLAGTVAGCLPLNCLWVAVGAGSKTLLQQFTADELTKDFEAFGLVATLLIAGVIGQTIYKVTNEESGTA